MIDYKFVASDRVSVHCNFGLFSENINLTADGRDCCMNGVESKPKEASGPKPELYKKTFLC
jgi:hypothetical protein